MVSPGIVYDRLSRGSTAYMALAGEFMRRQEQMKGNHRKWRKSES